MYESVFSSTTPIVYTTVCVCVLDNKPLKEKGLDKNLPSYFYGC